MKHVKIKNTGIIYEILARQVVSDLLSNNKSIAQEILNKYLVNPASDLYKEYYVYYSLSKTRFSDERRASEFVNEVIEYHKKLDSKAIDVAKYKLIGEIRKRMDINKLFEIRITDYKVLASVYKLLRAKSLNENVDFKTVVDAKYIVIDNLLGKFDVTPQSEFADILEEFENCDNSVRNLSYKKLIDKFNNKYSSLDGSQKELLRKYIYNFNKLDELRPFLNAQIDAIVEAVKLKNVEDDILNIKLKELCNQFDNIKTQKKLRENHIIAVLNGLELLNEFNYIEE